MKEYSISIKDRLKQLDFAILFCAVGMTMLSILILIGAEDPSTLFTMKRVYVQGGAALVGIIIMIAISLIDYDALINKYAFWMFIASVVLLLLVLVIGSDNGHGNKSWINIKFIGIDIQPSEFVKIIFICTFAKHIDIHKNEINKIANVLKLALHALIIIGCVLLSGDLGSALVFVAIVLVMLFCAGLSLWYFAALVAIVVIVSPLIWSMLKEYQQTRIIVGFNPDMDPETWGHQQIMSRNAIVAGGFRGAGLFSGTNFYRIPSAQSDFIFAVLCEKLGFIGAFIYILLNSILTVRLIWLARNARKDYGALICAGVTAIFITQTLENIGMCLAVLPVIGITLPFMSYGGSSVLSLYICLGLIMSISTHNKKYYFERERS